MSTVTLLVTPQGHAFNVRRSNGATTKIIARRVSRTVVSQIIDMEQTDADRDGHQLEVIEP